MTASASAAATGPPTAAPARRLVLLPRARTPESGPRRYRLARLEQTPTARADRFAHLKRSYD